MSTKSLAVDGKVVLITGANRGIGRALVDEALVRGAARVYAASRRPFEHGDDRVSPLALDVTDAASVERAAASVDALDVLVNNAGVSVGDDLSDSASLDHHLSVNVYGLHAVTQAFLPLLKASRGGIVNIVSLSAVAAVPIMPSYAASKAAALSLSQSQRALLAADGVGVHVVLPGPVDTDMTAGLELPKATPAAVAAEIFGGAERGEEEIFPDPASAEIADAWRQSVVKVLEGQFAQFVQPAPAEA
jgi:NAD(P)-dependent dehydrogenase (short-subunit alcohol dehydrogenase family)